MPAHINAFVYILAMSLVVFALLEKPLTASLVAPEDFRRRRNVWLAVTAAAFLSHSFWIYVFAAGVIVVLAAQRDRNPLALYFMLLVALPNFEMDVPGLGIVNLLFVLTHAKLLALLILAPMAFRLVQTPHVTTTTQRINHGFVVAFVTMIFFVTVLFDTRNMTLANGVRGAFNLLVQIWLPVYVCSRGVRDLRQLREIMAMAMLAFALLGLFAVFETFRHWLLYESLRAPLGVPEPKLTLYVLRESEAGAALRAMTTAGHPIVLGYLMGVAINIWTASRRSLQPFGLGLVALGVLCAGLIAALSRGPWMATAVGVMALILTGPNLGKRLAITVGIMIPLLLAVAVTPYGAKLVSYLPFVGSVERGTVDYRVKLFEVSMLVFWDNPIFGNFEALFDPRMEQMRQGQGIIDMVNSYLGIALQFGLVGVFLFVTPFLIALVACARTARAVEAEHPSMGITGRAFVGAILTTMITIATTSSIEYIPIVYWPLLGLATGYTAIALRWRMAQRSAAARQLRPRAARAPAARPTGVAVHGARGPLA